MPQAWRHRSSPVGARCREVQQDVPREELERARARLERQARRPCPEEEPVEAVAVVQRLDRRDHILRGADDVALAGTSSGPLGVAAERLAARREPLPVGSRTSTHHRLQGHMTDTAGTGISKQEYAERRARFAAKLREQRIDALFVAPSSDLEYLTGLERDLPSFGNVHYAHGWVTGALIAPDREPLYVLPRMFVTFHLWGRDIGEVVTVRETDDAQALFRKAVASIGDLKRVAVGARTWGETVIELGRAAPNAELVNGSPIVNELRRVKSDRELELMTYACSIADGAMAATADKVQPGVTMVDLHEEIEHQLRARGSRVPSFPTHLFSYGLHRHDSQDPTGLEPIAEGEPVMFDFGAVWQGYCSDFGRTVVAGEPHPEYARCYELMLAAQEAGRAAAVPGALASEVNAACRGPIEEAGLGETFRHRMGHGIGVDVHEWPFISEEDQTPLEAGMTFTDEPSIFWDDTLGVRIEDIVVCAEAGGEYLNEHSRRPVVNR